MKHRLRIIVLIAALILPMAPAMSDPASVSAATQGTFSGGFSSPVDLSNIVGTFTCTFAWAQGSGGLYIDKFNCIVTDNETDSYAVTARIWFRNNSSAPWATLEFKRLNGTEVAPFVKCSIKGDGLSKTCQRSRGTYNMKSEYRIRACLSVQGKCLSNRWIETYLTART